MFDGKADVVDVVLRHYYGACGWGTARLDAAISCVQYGPGLGDVIAAGDRHGRIHFICAQTGEKILSRLTGHTDTVMGVSFDPTGKKIVSCSQDKTIRFWDSATGAAIGSPVRAHSDWVKAVAWSPCGQWLASGGDDKMVYVYDTETFEVKWPLRGHDHWVVSVSWSPDGTRLASGSVDNTVRIWE